MTMRLVLLLTLVLAACGGSAASSDSGIRGQAVVMSCGVPFTEEECRNPPPYVGEINVRRPYGRPIIRTIRSAPDGRFEVRLPPGRYVLESEGSLPFLKAVDAIVRAHRFTDVRPAFDSGIR
jgi:hypothetical protein